MGGQDRQDEEFRFQILNSVFPASLILFTLSIHV
jgi:hypothetical protein